MKVSHEIELMVSCARVELDQAAIGKIQQLSTGTIDWDTFISICNYHKILPLVLHNLLTIDFPGFPQELKSQLEENYIFENSLHNYALVEALFSILGLFKKNKIMAVPFKGPVLAENVFGDVTLRRYLDLDILISKNDATKAVELLLDNGFIPEEETFPMGVGRGGHLEKVVWVSLIHPEKHISVDLQWDISNRFTNLPITMEAMSERLELVELTGREVVSLPVEELLCYLCLHGTKHRWLALDYVCCVAELVRVRKDIDWQYVEQYAKKIHCVNVLFLGLLLARDILGAELPSSIEAKIGKENNLKALAEKVYNGLFSDYRGTMVVSEKFDPFLFQIKDSFVDRIVYLIKVVFIPSKEDLRLFNVPESFSFLRYILRPLRLIKKYCHRRYKTSTNKS